MTRSVKDIQSELEQLHASLQRLQQLDDKQGMRMIKGIIRVRIEALQAIKEEESQPVA